MKSLAIAVAILLLAASPALACPMLETASPKVGSTVDGSLKTVTVVFTSTIYPQSSTLDVVNEAGEKMNTGKPFGVFGTTTGIVTRLHPLKPGRYTVSWNVLCDCGSMTPGDYKFTVE